MKGIIIHGGHGTRLRSKIVIAYDTTKLFTYIIIVQETLSLSNHNQR